MIISRFKMEKISSRLLILMMLCVSFGLFGFVEGVSNRTLSTSASSLKACTSSPPMLDGASLYVINLMVAKYNCLPPYRGHAYSRCNTLTKQWSRVNLTCVNVKLPPDQVVAPNLPPRRKTLISDDFIAAANALTGIQLSDSPSLPPNTHLVATMHQIHQVVTAVPTPSTDNKSQPKRPRADAAAKTCGIPPHIAGTVFIVVNEFMVKYACIDEEEGAVRWKNYAYYFCTPETRSWRGSPPDCGMGRPKEDDGADELESNVRLRARKILQQQQRQRFMELTAPRVQHQPRSLPSSAIAPNNHQYGMMAPFDNNYASSGHLRNRGGNNSPYSPSRSVWMPQQLYPPIRRANSRPIRPPSYGNNNQLAPTFQQSNFQSMMLTEQAHDAMQFSSGSNHLPSVSGMAMRERRTMSSGGRPLVTRISQKQVPDWDTLVTSSSAQLTEPVAPPPLSSRTRPPNLLSNDRRFVHDKDIDEQQQIAAVFEREHLKNSSTAVTPLPSPSEWERLKLRTEGEFSVATIGDVVLAQDARRQSETNFALSNRQQRQLQNSQRQQKSETNNNEIPDPEAEEEERLRRLEMSSKKMTSQWQRCDATRACTTTGPRIGRRASVVYRSFSAEQACPGDFVRIACQSGHNTSWHTSFCTHRRYWTFVPACGG